MFIGIPILLAPLGLLVKWIVGDDGVKIAATPVVTVTMQNTQHTDEPNRGEPVKDQFEYAPVYNQYFLPAEHQLDLVTIDDDGNTNLKLGLYSGQLILEAPNGLLPDRANGQIYKLGIFTGTLRGSSYYKRALLHADTRPPKPAILQRELNNKYDKNAVAIHASNAGLIGYVNNKNAARLAKRMDSGEPYLGIFTSGSRPGDDSNPVSILIVPERTMRSILKNSGITGVHSSLNH